MSEKIQKNLKIKNGKKCQKITKNGNLKNVTKIAENR